MPSSAVYMLCNYLGNSGKLESCLIKKVIQPVWPNIKYITKHDIFNIRVKIIKLLPVYRKSSGDYDRFKEVVNSSNMLNKIDSEVFLDDE